MSFRLRPGRIGNLVIVGLGEPEWLATLLTDQAAHILCVDADPECTSRLEAALPSKPNLTQIPCILDTVTGTRLYPVTNVPRVALLAQTPDLKQMFPGLRVIDTISVGTCTAADVIAACSEVKAPNVLCLNTLGVGLREIGELMAPIAGDRTFSDVYLRACTHPRLAPEHTEDGLKAFMYSNGYMFVGYADTDPDFPVLRFFEGSLAEKLMQAKAKIADLQKALVTLQGQADEHRQAATARSARLVEISEELAEVKLALAAADQPAKPKRAPADKAKTAQKV